MAQVAIYIITITGNIPYRYIGDECKDLINRICTYGLKDKDFHLTNFDNQIGLKNIINRHFKEKGTDVFENHFILDRFIKNLADIEDKINMIVEIYGPKTKPGIEDKERAISILNAIKYDLLDYFLDPNTIIEMHKKFGRDKIDSILNKYSKKTVVQ